MASNDDSEKNVANHNEESQRAVTSRDENTTVEDVVDPWNVATDSATGIDYDKLIGESLPVIRVQM